MCTNPNIDRAIAPNIDSIDGAESIDRLPETETLRRRIRTHPSGNSLHTLESDGNRSA